MSARSSSRKPSTARADLDSQRMPFEAAEALLWGRKTHQDHEWLFSQMKDLESQHAAYDARISATEAIAEAAEAATHRIRHMETRIAAMESDDKERPFDKWAENAITQLKLFVDHNVNVRQKLNNLEGRFCEVVDDFERVGGVSRDVAGLLRRLDVLERESGEDKRRVVLLEREVAGLRGMRQMPASGDQGLKTDAVSSRVSDLAHVQAMDGDPDGSDTTTEEDFVPPSRAFVQVPRSPSMNLAVPDTTMQPPATKGRQSARMNIMRRPSIYDPRVVPTNTEVQPQAPVKRQLPTQPRIAKSPEKPHNTGNNAGKRKRDDDALTQRVTRARVGEGAQPKQQAAPVVTKKTTSTESRPALGNSDKRKLVVVLPSQKPAVVPPTQKQTQGAREAKPSKIAPRRPDGPSCKQCRQQHQGCDRARPACGRCVKSARSGACDYPDIQSAATQAGARSTNTQKNNAPLQQARRPAKPNTQRDLPTGTKSGELRPSTAQSVRPRTTKGTSSVEPARAPRSRKPPRILPDATDLETFLKMQQTEGNA